MLFHYPERSNIRTPMAMSQHCRGTIALQFVFIFGTDDWFAFKYDIQGVGGPNVSTHTLAFIAQSLSANMK